MISKFKVIILLILTSSTIFCQGNLYRKDAKIKVLLQEVEEQENIILKVSTQSELILGSPKSNRKKIYQKELNIELKNGNIFINNEKTTYNILKIHPSSGYLKVNEKEYQGSFLITKYNKNLLLINDLNLEDYIFSVLRTESWPNWPLEVNKVLAIACRSYAVAKIIENKQAKLPYHIKNTNKHQTYTGIHNCKIIKQAVEETRSIILGYNKRPILAMFDSCCGGVIPAQMKDVNFENSPYLQRKYACNFCKNSRSYNWQAEYDLTKFEEIIRKEIPNFKRLRSINITRKDNTGIVHEIEVRDQNKRYKIGGKKFYSMLKAVKSFCFSITKKLGKIIIKGKGIGHHLGLCQWGARNMIDQGWDYKSILLFYYPKTNFMKLH